MVFIFLSIFAIGQNNKILVTQTTVKIGSVKTEELYFGFDEGDKVIFNYELIKGKNLKEVEIFEYPNSSIFMDYKTKEIKDKIIEIHKKGIYKFSFKNTSLGIRICKIKIERIPANTENTRFNTTVYWKILRDTNYYYKDEKYLISKDTNIINVVSSTVKVHSTTNAHGNKTSFNFTLPDNTVSWSYYIGVDQSGQEAYENATKNLAKKVGPLVAKIPNYGPLAALALGGTSYIAKLQNGEDVDYYIVKGNNVNLFLSGEAFSYIKKGKVINDFGRITSPLTGNLHFCLENDNAVAGITVTVKIVAVTVKENWGIRKVKKYNVKIRKEPYLKE